MDDHLQEVVAKIDEKFHPISIFLYGSRARADFLEGSDYEVGVLYRAGSKISRAELKELNPYSNIVVYPFEYEGVLAHRLDTPFPERIYLRDLAKSAKTIFGEEVVEKMTPPSLRAIDVLQTLVFHTGIALAAVLSHRQGDIQTANAEFSKSCLFSARCLVVLESGEFPLTYDEIYEKALKLELGDYKEVIAHALEVRKGAPINPAMLFKNLSFQNQFIKPRLLALIEEKGATHTLLP